MSDPISIKNLMLALKTDFEATGGAAEIRMHPVDRERYRNGNDVVQLSAPGSEIHIITADETIEPGTCALVSRPFDPKLRWKADEVLLSQLATVDE